MNLKMDLSSSGLSMFFRDYQIEALTVLRSSNKGLGSRAVWEDVNRNMAGSISRASIINFLNDMVDLGILVGTGETGKGGHRLRYSHRMNEKELKEYLVEQVENKLREMKEA